MGMHFLHTETYSGSNPLIETFHISNCTSEIMNTTWIWTDKQRLSGKPCVRGQRFSIAQMFAELVDKGNLQTIADDFDIPLKDLQGAMLDVISYLCEQKINMEYISSDPETRGGENCLIGHRIPISMLLVDLREDGVNEEADNYDLDTIELEGMLNDLAILFDCEFDI